MPSFPLKYASCFMVTSPISTACYSRFKATTLLFFTFGTVGADGSASHIRAANNQLDPPTTQNARKMSAGSKI